MRSNECNCLERVKAKFESSNQVLWMLYEARATAETTNNAPMASDCLPELSTMSRRLRMMILIRRILSPGYANRYPGPHMKPAKIGFESMK
jgi:hypothetical protein